MPIRHVGLAVLVAAIWGVNFVVIDVGLGNFPPLLFSALRFTVAAIPAVFFVGSPKVAWKWVVGVGIALGVLKFGSLFIGMHVGMPAGLSSVVLQCQAMFTAAFAALFLREKSSTTKLIGMGLAAAGIVVMGIAYSSGSNWVAFALVVAAGAFWGVSNVFTRKASPPDMFRFMVWVSVIPPIPLFLLSLIFEGPQADAQALTHLTWAGVGAIVYVAAAATLFGFGVWGFLLRTHPASTVAPFSLLVPIFGITAAAVFNGERITLVDGIAAAMIVAGVALTSLARPATAATQAAGLSPQPSGSPR
jgi:O-acetylserine/cysteine efflux transporter